MTKPSVIRVGQQFQAEVPAWHGPVPLDGSAPMMPEEIDLTGDVLALPEKEVAVYGVPAPRSKRVDARREKEEAEREKVRDFVLELSMNERVQQQLNTAELEAVFKEADQVRDAVTFQKRPGTIIDPRTSRFYKVCEANLT